MSLTCSICQEVPESPCVSQVSGHVFERRLIEKYIQENGTDPMNGEPLTVEQLVDIKVPPSAKPRPPSATSIPAILKALQDEWDAVMLHSFTLRQQLQTARQELSQTMYQHDAACRVIARLTKEVTAAREALATLKPQTTQQPMGSAAATPQHPPPTPEHAAGDAQQATAAVAAAAALEEPSGMSDVVTGRLEQKAKELTAQRKQRGKSAPEGLCSVELVSAYRQLASHIGLHSASNPGILCLDAFLANPARVVTGGNDKTAAVFNTDAQQLVCVLHGHTKKVTSVAYHPYEEDLVFTGGQDSLVLVWDPRTAAVRTQLRAHEDAVTALSVHPTGDFLLSGSRDGTWAFADIRAGRLLVRVADPAGQQPLTCAQLHPDGMIAATGTQDAQVKMWDLREQKFLTNFEQHTAPLTALAFSENGYYLATAAEDSTVRLWDLRKLKNFKVLQLGGSESGQPSGPASSHARALAFDHSGTYLAAGGGDIRLYHTKQFNELCMLDNHTAAVTGLRFGTNARSIVSCSLDRSLKVFGCGSD
ncbi:hypothetical protein BOX15_Mlig023330g1 [Macrostomum lignano]|uniref:Pre-mRNA-processing factor 19 n=1 Tax=Macrostomum lignano TaxID=282301 RepID=A0A267F5B4_9PLAT|nr:hypothetical protein BOX15_Mlig023330g1 [Macrostomum lignano]